jgi:calcium-dependent protein kinase
LLQGVNYLHENGFCHRDLKPENIMLVDKESEEIKIIDFGLSKSVNNTPFQVLHSAVGTPYYVAPEVLDHEYDKRCDVWSIGVTLYVMLCGYPPFRGKTTKQIAAKIRKGKLVFFDRDWGNISEEAKDLVKGLLTVDMKQRLTIREALDHPWFANQMFYTKKSQGISSLSESFKNQSFSTMNISSELDES